jgi:hypothetical protein
VAARLAMRTYDCRSRTPRFLASRVSPLIAACKSFASVGKVMFLGCTVVSTVTRAKSFVRRIRDPRYPRLFGALFGSMPWSLPHRRGDGGRHLRSQDIVTNRIRYREPLSKDGLAGGMIVSSPEACRCVFPAWARRQLKKEEPHKCGALYAYA